MRPRDRIAQLKDMVRLKELQAKDAETCALKAAVQSVELREHAKAADERRSAYRLGWSGAADSENYDLDAARRWAAACCDSEAHCVEREEQVQLANAGEDGLRRIWHSAMVGVRASRNQYDETRRMFQRRREETDLHRVIEQRTAIMRKGS